MVTLLSLPPDMQRQSSPIDQQDTHTHPAASQMITTTPIVPAIALASFVEARLAAMRRREQMVSDHLTTHGVWPTEITMSALDIISLPIQEWAAFRPDHGIVVAISYKAQKKEAGIAC